jgi:rRNA maturation RNase YbeY
VVEFFCEDIDFSPAAPQALREWIDGVVANEGHIVGDINFIYCSDPFLLNINKTYLNLQTFTDIITFDQSTNPDTIAGDIFISIDQVRSNSIKYQEPFRLELKRVMVHGVLHLLGYNDKSVEEMLEMSKKEEAYLSL